MGSELPDLDRSTFEARLAACSPGGLAPEAAESLFLHYRELRRWNPRLSLVGPGTRETVVERHYGESLAALPWIPPGRQRVLDIGSGGGFPGLVLAAARPDLEVILLEPRQRKWAFLKSACRKALLSCKCLNARVDSASPERLPSEIDLALVRALRLEGAQMQAVAEKMTPRGAFFLWAGSSSVPIPSGFRKGRERRLPEPGVGRLLEIRRQEQGERREQ